VPGSFELLYEQALDAARGQRFERAVELYDAALQLNPAHAETHYKRGNALRSLGLLDAAIVSYGLAIDSKANYAYAYCNLGVALQALGSMPAALLSYDRAIALDPTDAISHYNRALLMQDTLRWDEALQSYDRAIELDPRFADAQYNRAVMQLFCGDFEHGWRNFEWRWKNAERLGFGTERGFPQPLWLGETDIAGKRVLVHSEGGLGDTVQFCRYIPLLAARGAIVYLEIQAPLRGVLAGIQGVSKVISKGEAPPEFDCHCPLMSLPLAMNTTLDTIPFAAKYLHTDVAAAARWRALLGKTKRPRVGIVWSGNPRNAIDQRRSIRLSDWTPHLPDECDYFCLQDEVREADAAVLADNARIRRFDAKELDFVSTAALCECMDVVISVDTSIAHLCGALGLPIWILLPLVPDWRWLRERPDSPWYLTAKLFRQKTPGDWDEVLTRVATELRRVCIC
jgi:hypothetical protein